MKKLLIGVILGLIIVLLGFTIVKGYEIGKLIVLGVSGIEEKNENLENVVKEATKLASTDYQQKQDDLKNALKELENKKKEYEDLKYINEELEANGQIYDSYEIDFLWIRIGNHAKSEGIEMEVTANDLTDVSSATEINQPDKKYKCNLSFTATGTYVGIASFIEDIEDDSKLGFKIEEFTMTSASQNSDIIQAKFTCKDVLIKGVTTSTVTTTEKSEQNTTQ